MKIALRFLSNLILLCIALVLGVVLLPVGFIYGIISSFFKVKWYEGVDYISTNFLMVAVGIDQLGNVTCAGLFNLCLLSRNDNRYPFGNPDETISGVLGKNEKAESLSTIGKGLNWILNFVDRGHSIKSIEEDENFAVTKR